MKTSSRAARFPWSPLVFILAVALASAIRAQTPSVIAAGDSHTLFIKADHTLWAMGANEYGQLCVGSSGGTRLTLPTSVGSGVASVVAGYNVTLFLKTDATLWSVGYNSSGQLGDGASGDRLAPVQIATGVASASAGAVHLAFVKTDGTLWTAGYNYSGQLGDGTNLSRLSPVQIATGVASVSARRDYTLFVKTDGTLWATGYNGDGQLGLGDTANRNAPTKVAASGVTFVKAGPHHALFILSDGSLWATGYNSDGQLGLGNTTSQTSPVRVATGAAAGTAPAITTQPVSQSALVGASVTLTVVATGTPAPTYQWRKNGTPIANATTAALVLANLQTTDAGTYTVTVTNLAGTAISSDATLAVITSSTAPAITAQPLDVSVVLGASATFSVAATGAAPLTYQWAKDGRALPGATAASLTISAATVADRGAYSVTIRNAAGSATSRTATLSVSAAFSRLANLAVRALAGTGSQTLTLGFVSTGSASTSKPLLIRAVAPTLGSAPFNVPGTLADPSLLVYQGPTKVATNDNWSDDASTRDSVAATAAALGAFSLPLGSRDAALLLRLAPNGYTAQVDTNGGPAGVALIEAYDAETNPASRLINLSARTQVGTGSDILIVGFVIQGNAPKTVLIRAIGPTLGSFGVTGALADPQLTLLTGSTVLASNDDWWRDAGPGTGAAALNAAFGSVQAFGLDAQSKDAALIATLSPGSYTAQVNGANATTGVALVEVYELP